VKDCARGHDPAVGVLVAVPVKRFFVAKQRLSPLLSRRARSQLGRDLATHTLETVEQAGAAPLVLAADPQVAAWAVRRGWRAEIDSGGGLDGAATAAASEAASRGLPWLIVHADLPLLTPDEVAGAAATLAQGRSPIAPSDDGGTSLIGGHEPLRFSYGPGSFHRHLPRLAVAEVVVRLGLILDLDDPTDFAAAVAHRRGSWLARYAALR
jgi:2-phospho-L-lactate guanylyltransferase